MKRAACLLTLVLVLGVAPQGWAGAKEEVEQVAQETEKAWMAESPEGLIAKYAEDAHFFGATAPFRIEGRKDLAAALTGLFKAFPTRRLALRQVAHRIYGDNVAISDGYFQFTMVSAKGEARTLNGRFSLTRVKTGGQWLIVSHHASVLPSQ